MSRPLRVEAEDMLYHVLARGNEGRPIFRTDRCYVHFLELLEEYSDRFDVEVWSYVLMPNHYHLLVKTRRANLSRAMQWLGVSYAAWFNTKHQRRGHLFQGRFKSFVVGEDNYLHRLILYIHRNPLRARLVERLAAYPWSSYRFLAYAGECPGWLQRDAVLTLFDRDPVSLRKEIQHYSEEKDRLLEDLWRGLVLGSARGILQLRRKVKDPPHPEKPQTKILDRDLDIQQIVRRFRKVLRVSPDTVELWRSPACGRRRPERDLLIWCLCRIGKHTSREIADFLGMTSSAVSHARKRADAALSCQKSRKRQIEVSLLSTFKM